MTRFSEQKLSDGVLSMGVRPATRKFGVLESTVRGIIKNYKEAKVEDEELRELVARHRGVKTLLPSELDDKVLQMIKI